MTVPSPRLFRLVWVLGGCALLLGLARDRVLNARPKARLLAPIGANVPWFTGEFKVEGAYPTTEQGLLPPKIPTAGSWIDGDEWQGRSETAWFTASARVIHVGVSGYPQHVGCKVTAEFRTDAGEMTRVDCPLADPRELWSDWEISRPAGATAVRVVAEDRASNHAGWVAFSHPFTNSPAWIVAAYQQLQIWTTTALALTLIWAPGLIWLGRKSERSSLSPEIDTLILLGAGPLVLATAGVIVWLVGFHVKPAHVAFAVVAFAWSAIGVVAYRLRFTWPESDVPARLFAVMILLVVAVVAKSFYSVGPAGELFRGTVSRNFEMADRIDSRYSFYVVEAAANRRSPIAPDTDALFSPWTFFSRGPLAGLASIPIVLSTGGVPAMTLPEDRWAPFDRLGFAAYRITMIVLAGAILLALFRLLRPLVGEGWAMVGAGLVALAPFGAHEMMFTWPKWTATAWVVASFALAHARRPFAGGVALAIGFLFHPLALLWAPWVALWSAGRVAQERSKPGRVEAHLRASDGSSQLPNACKQAPTIHVRSWRSLVGPLVKFSLGVALFALPWMTIGALMPHSAHTPLAGQTGFFHYFTRADWQPATWDTWRHTRWLNFANTFVPLHGYLADASFNHPKLNSAYEASPPLVKFGELWWNSLPFAMGLGLWALSLPALVRGWQRWREATILFVIAPALFITAYWGMDPLGLMRECGHPLFVAIVVLTVYVAAREDGIVRRILAHRAVPWLQLPETWLMLWLTTLANPHPWAVQYEQLDGVVFLINVLALIGTAWLLAGARVMVAANGIIDSTAPLAPTAGFGDPAPHQTATFAGLARPPTWVVLLIGGVILAVRRPDQIFHPQLWAEDGIFYFQAHEIGVRAFALEVAGYFQFAPRIMAALAQLVDPAWAPRIFGTVVLALTLYTMSRVLSRRCPLPLPVWSALAIVLVPDAAEVLLNANNIQWVLAAAGVLLLISDDPQRPRQWVHDSIAAMFFGLTGPFCILLTPFFVARAFLRRTRASFVLATLTATCALAQAVSILRHPQPLAANATLDVSAMAAFPGLRLAAVALFGAVQPDGWARSLALALGIALFAAIIWLAWRPGDNRIVRSNLALLFFAFLASTLFRTWHSMPVMNAAGAASRYLFPLQLLLLWLLLAMQRDRAKPVRVLCALAATWMILVNLPRLRIAPVPDKHWADYAPRLRAGEEVTIPINPEGWSFTFPAHKP